MTKTLIEERPMAKKHAKSEIAGMLVQADDLATQGKIQSEIARTLGVSVMTLHRWRKAVPEPGQAMNGSSRGDQTQQTRIAELQLKIRGCANW
jgi:hypothetical protein